METIPDEVLSIAHQNNADITYQFELKKPNGSGSYLLVAIKSRTTGLVCLLLDNKPITFLTGPGMETTWFHGWGLLHKNPSLVIINEGWAHSVGIYHLNGAPATILFQSVHGTDEVVYRVMRGNVSSVGGNRHLLSLNIPPLNDL